jgi:hypothetical protein
MNRRPNLRAVPPATEPPLDIGRAMRAERDDPERWERVHIAAVIERLIDALGLAVAVSCRGNIALSDDMLTGVEGYLAECIARHARLAAFMAECRNSRPPFPGVPQ